LVAQFEIRRKVEASFRPAAFSELVAKIVPSAEADSNYFHFLFPGTHRVGLAIFRRCAAEPNVLHRLSPNFVTTLSPANQKADSSRDTSALGMTRNARRQGLLTDLTMHWLR
jgi:hypothetical protein